MNNLYVLPFCVLFLVGSIDTFGAEWDEQQSGLWRFVEQSWVDDAGETGKWPADYVHDDVMNWSAEWPVPRGKDSMSKWITFRDAQSETLEYELFLHKIIVAGDTGDVFYSVVAVVRNAEGKLQRNVENIVETLVRSDGSWKYIGLTSFGAGDDGDD